MFFFVCLFFCLFFTRNKISTTGEIKIDFFGIPGDSSSSHNETFTLQCKISGNSASNRYWHIGIGQKNKDGSYHLLTTGNLPIIKVSFNDFRCKHSQEFVCQVRYFGDVEIRKTFVAAQRECKFFICKNHISLLIDIKDS